jgi:hypothetical protein
MGKCKFSPWFSFARRRAWLIREIDAIKSTAPSYRYFGELESVSTRTKKAPVSETLGRGKEYCANPDHANSRLRGLIENCKIS